MNTPKMQFYISAYRGVTVSVCNNRDWCTTYQRIEGNFSWGIYIKLCNEMFQRIYETPNNLWLFELR